jgi:hypothetical protein
LASTEGTTIPTEEVTHSSVLILGPAAAEDRRYLIVPAKEHAVGHVSQPANSNIKNLFQGFCPPLVDPFRLSRWFKVTNLDPWMQYG